jgi:AmiR/NasT family two-component response regulator
VYEDVTTGYKCADWFALHGYQATMTSAVHHLERNLKELRPDVIVVRLSSAPTPLHSTVPRLKMTCPQVPIIAMVDQIKYLITHSSILVFATKV